MDMILHNYYYITVVSQVCMISNKNTSFFCKKMDRTKINEQRVIGYIYYTRCNMFMLCKTVINPFLSRSRLYGYLNAGFHFRPRHHPAPRRHWQWGKRTRCFNRGGIR